MKKWGLTTIAIALMFVVCFSSIAAATLDASYYFDYYDASVYSTGNGNMIVEFTVDGTGRMTQIGAKTIVVQERVGNSWKTVRTFNSSSYSNMMATNKSIHSSELSFRGTVGKEYRVIMTVYATNATGSEQKQYTSLSARCR